MTCEKCNSPLNYGESYCNTCGEKASKSIYEDRYNHSLWGKLDKAKDVYDTLFLKKITDSIICKIIVLLALLAFVVFKILTNSFSISFAESGNYTVQYNKELDEYYILTKEDEVYLNLNIPKLTDRIKLSEFTGESPSDEKAISTEQFVKEGVCVKKGSFDYLLIEAVSKDKSLDTVKVLVADRK